MRASGVGIGSNASDEDIHDAAARSAGKSRSDRRARRATLQARSILRELFGRQIRLVPEPDGGLTAHWNLHVSALLRQQGSDGSGGRI